MAVNNKIVSASSGLGSVIVPAEEILKLKQCCVKLNRLRNEELEVYSEFNRLPLVSILKKNLKKSSKESLTTDLSEYATYVSNLESVISTEDITDDYVIETDDLQSELSDTLLYKSNINSNILNINRMHAYANVNNQAIKPTLQNVNEKLTFTQTIKNNASASSERNLPLYETVKPALQNVNEKFTFTQTIKNNESVSSERNLPLYETINPVLQNVNQKLTFTQTIKNNASASSERNLPLVIDNNYSMQNDTYIMWVPVNQILQTGNMNLSLEQVPSINFGTDVSAKIPIQPIQKPINHNSSEWTEDAILTLISLTVSLDNTFKGSTPEEAHLWNIIASKLNEKGYNFDSSMCYKKFKCLITIYKLLKSKSKLASPSWKYFEVLNKAFGDLPPEQKSRKKLKKSLQFVILNYLRNRTVDDKRRWKELKKLEERNLKLLNDYYNKIS